MSIKRYCLVMPAVVILALGTLIPFLFGLVISFSKWDLRTPVFSEHPFIGLSNYIAVLLDPFFHTALQFTIIFVIVAVSLEVLIGLGLAVLYDKDFPLKGLVITSITIPMLLPPLLTGLSWKMLLHPNLGLINYYLGLLGFDWMYHPIIGPLIVILLEVWSWTPFSFLLLYAGLQAIPKEIFEVASIDGASEWQRLRYIILPMLRNYIMLVVLFRTVGIGGGGLKVFDIIQATTKGGPGTLTYSLTMYSWLRGFYFGNLGEGAAISIITLIIAIFCGELILRIGKKLGVSLV